jgi:hypothetical protein
MLYNNWKNWDNKKVLLCTHEDDSITCKTLSERWWYIWNRSYHKTINIMLHNASTLVTVWHTLCMEWKVCLTLNIEGLRWLILLKHGLHFFFFFFFTSSASVLLASLSLYPVSLIYFPVSHNKFIVPLKKKKEKKRGGKKLYECGLSEIWASQFIGPLKYGTAIHIQLLIMPVNYSFSMFHSTGGHHQGVNNELIKEIIKVCINVIHFMRCNPMSEYVLWVVLSLNIFF